MFPVYRLNAVTRLKTTNSPYVHSVGLRTGLDDGYRLFCTISPNPKTKHKVVRTIPSKDLLRPRIINRSVGIEYGHMSHKEQYDYCIKYVETCYLPFLSPDTKLYGVFELNQSGNLHMHFILKSPTVMNKTTLMIFQREVMTSYETIRNMSRKKVDYMNNIVELTKSNDEINAYMQKTNEECSIHFPNYYL